MDNYDTEDEVIEVEETEAEPAVDEPEEEASEEPEEIDWEARAKKAEAAIIKAKAKPKATPANDTKLSTFDLLALQKANIETEEDLDEVMQFAGYKNISVADALKSNILKTVLSEKAEERKSAMAVNTGTGRRANNGQVSDERLLADAAKGIMPNEADIGRLAILRMKNK